MKRKILREQWRSEGRARPSGRWCELQIELTDGRAGPCLSICGAAGCIVKRSAAKREALEYWTSYFEDDPAEIVRLGRRTARGAAKHVLAVDGELHGLDVRADDGKLVFIVESFGQIRETLAEFFPEAVPYFKWHLNDMKAECEHQEARGESYATHPGAVCPDCGYELGSAWLARELPPHVIAWAKGELCEAHDDCKCEPSHKLAMHCGERPKRIDAMLKAYVACALWSSTDNSTDSGGDPLDKNYGPEDIAGDTLAAMREDCTRFLDAHAEDIGSELERAGHDFWLTRNGHGAGFWDGDWPEEAGKRLSAGAKEFGEVHLYVDGDGEVRHG